MAGKSMTEIRLDKAHKSMSEAAGLIIYMIVKRRLNKSAVTEAIQKLEGSNQILRQLISS